MLSRWSAGARRLRERPLFVDLALQLDDAVDERFRPWRAAWYEHVDGHDLVHTLHDCVVVEDAANRSAGSHGDHVLGLRHLVVDAPENRRHLPGQPAGD